MLYASLLFRQFLFDLNPLCSPEMLFRWQKTLWNFNTLQQSDWSACRGHAVQKWHSAQFSSTFHNVSSLRENTADRNGCFIEHAAGTLRQFVLFLVVLITFALKNMSLIWPVLACKFISLTFHSLRNHRYAASDELAFSIRSACFMLMFGELPSSCC